MQQALLDVLTMMLIYCVIFIATIIFMNFLSKGYLATFLRVKASRGKWLLVRAFSLTGKYYAIGKFKEDNIIYTARDKKVCTYDVKKGDVFREMGVDTIEIDEVNGAVLSPDYSEAGGYDPKKFDNILTRALQRPELRDNQEKIILMLQVLQSIALAFIIWLLFNLLKMVETMKGGGVV